MKNKKQLFRFGIVGGINTAIDFGLLFLLSAFGLSHIFANSISTTTAFIFSFFANKKFTFKTTDTNIKREIALFIIVTLFGLWVLQNLVIWLITPMLSRFISSSNLVLFVAKILATCVSLVWNYLLYDRVVFKKVSTS